MGKVKIFVFTPRHQKELRFFAAGFDKFREKPCCYFVFSVPLYIPVFSSLFYSSAFQPINYITFVLFHGFREHCKHKFYSRDDSRLCCLVLYIFTILHFPMMFCLKNLIQWFISLFLALKTSYHILFTPMSQWAALSLD